MAEHRILIIDDEPGIRLTLQDRLQAEGYQTAAAPDGLSGEAKAREGGWDVIILDLMLPGRDGLSICKRLRESGNNTPILMLTARNTDLDVVVGLRQGADDYLRKPYSMGELLARIEVLLRRSGQAGTRSGTSGLLMGVQGFGNFVLDLDQGEFRGPEGPMNLNSLEFRLLHYLISNPNKLMSREVILEEVWGYDRDTTTRTVDVHVARLRHHLGESDNPRHIMTVRGRGYKFCP